MRAMVIDMDMAESCAFDFFRREATSQLPGSSLDWKRLVLQTSYGEPSLAHAATAIGFLIQSYGSPSAIARNGVDHHALALRHYNKSIYHAARYIENLSAGPGSASIEVILLLSLLFFSFEVLSGEDMRACAHLRTGLRVLYEKVRDPLSNTCSDKRVVVMHPVPRNEMELLLNTFVRLDGDPTLTDQYETYLHAIVAESIPNFFSSLEEAQVHLDGIESTVLDLFHELDKSYGRPLVGLHWGTSALSREELFCLSSAYSRYVPMETHPHLTERMDVAKSELQAWCRALAMLPHQEEHAAARLMLQIKHLDLWIETSKWKDENEIMGDRFDKEYAHLLNLSEQYVGLHLDVDLPIGTVPTTRPGFCVGTALIANIAGIAWYCRNPRTRRRCIALIRRINMRGVADSEYLAAVSEKVMEVEETQARLSRGKDPDEELMSGDIPEEARVIEVEMCPHQGREEFWKLHEGRIVYVTSANGAGSELSLHEVAFVVRRTTS
ncbi:hypothetical protein DOTSEDRAFT_143148 [Dothistroma septosporum NZE10]|uniref:Transcription factor domain-containing protein n=1 Tax=Dothistroma septosporum (strain NZE10 / CBS 128990) TaxID=675120 RepID=N1Q0U4_DOTSN|nr:hypothetical protein DOTSEDRAFT_143148 [Dothistroma septosporum NZE10]